MNMLHKKRTDQGGGYTAWYDSPTPTVTHWLFLGTVVISLTLVCVLMSWDSVSASSLTPTSTVATSQTITKTFSGAGVVGVVEAKQKVETASPSSTPILPTKQVSAASLSVASSSPAAPCKTGRCILVVLSQQRVYAFQDGKVVKTSLVSTGVRRHPTPVGTFRVYRKTRSQKMSGRGYYLPHVPYILWFKGGYSLHGTYWHHNFGHRMSHGCVNLPTPVAHWMYDWASVGTTVTIRR